MNSKEENARKVMQYIEICDDTSMGSHARGAKLNTEEIKRVSFSRETMGLPFDIHMVKCVKSSECQSGACGYCPQGESPAADGSNFVIPPLCQEHLLEAAEALDQLLVQALLSLDQKIAAQNKVVMDEYATDLSSTRRMFPSTDNRCWPPNPPGKAKNRME